MTVQIVDISIVASSPLHPLSTKVRQFIWDQVQLALRSEAVTSLVLTGGTTHFSAGADLTEFAAAATLLSSTDNGNQKGPPTLIDVVQCLEDSPKPIVAAIAGTCLGGGLELALACHYRVCLSTASTKLGLPEVHVGVIPGAGGTQRLPKLIGLATATQLILTGASVNAHKALKLGLVDAVVDDPQQLLSTAQQWASWAEVTMPLMDPAERRLARRRLKESAAVAHNVLAQAELALPKQGSDGLHAALRALRASYMPSGGMAVESQAFVETLLSAQGQARRYAFFAVRQAQKLLYPHLASPLKAHHALLQKTQTSIQAAVIGGGTMGTGIALVLLLKAGYHVTLVDIDQAAVDKGLATIRKTLESQVRRKKLKPDAAHRLQKQCLRGTTQLSDLKQCQLVVEAVVENLQIKRDLFRQLDAITPPDCILLSNTSTLDIDALASALSPVRRQWFLGWHFFSPAHVMPLVEIVRGRDACPEAITLLQLVSKQCAGKIAVVVGNCDGFCGNRLLRPYSLESAFLLHDGSAIAEVDAAISNFGVALGPFQMGDLAGNDVAFNIRVERQWTTRTGEPGVKRPARYADIADTMIVQHGRVGQKAGKGWYDYDPSVGKGRTPLHSKEMEQLIEQSQQGTGSAPKVSPDEIVRRCLYPLVNEGFKCLEEGIVDRPSDIDVVYLNGYGWPAWRGGPMHWADHTVGLPNLLKWLQTMSRQFPTVDHFVPSALLVDCVQRGLTCQEWHQQRQTRQEQPRQQTRSKL